MKEKVYLRPLCVDDAAVSWKWRNDAELWKYTASRPNVFVTEQMEREWAVRVINDSTRKNFAICLAPSDRYIGNIYLINISDGKGELGIFIGERDCHGFGYAKDALNLLKDIAHREFGVEQISIGVNSNNVSALITYLKCGARLNVESWLQLRLDAQAQKLT